MASNLSKLQQDIINKMIYSKSKNIEIVEAVG